MPYNAAILNLLVACLLVACTGGRPAPVAESGLLTIDEAGVCRPGASTEGAGLMAERLCASWNALSGLSLEQIRALEEMQSAPAARQHLKTL